MTTRAKRPTPTQVRAARRRRQSRRKKMLAIGGFTIAGGVAFLLILSLILPGLPLDTLFRGGSGDIFGTGAAEAQAFSAEVADVQVEPVENDSPGDSAAAPPLPPNPILGGVDIFYNCPDGCDDLVAQLTTIVDELDSADAPIGLNPKTDMDARILLIGADSNEELEAFDEAAIRGFIETNTAQ
ncbi:MAG: hypothetical protein OXI16_13050 [Chloroflexota bacterium]|nr:hypothetical protein [Chloroflexota bacterium]